jgi:hypothetical protein
MGNRTKASIMITLFVCGYFSLVSPARQVKEEDFENFEDDLLPLAKLGEQVTAGLLSLKSFRCQEKIVLREFEKKSQSSRQQEFLNTYEVRRQPDKRAKDQLFFSETRLPRNPGNDDGPGPSYDFPLIENPFTGYIIQAFSFENRLANDFKKVRKEMVAGRNCLVFSFETVPEISTTKILVTGKPVTLRQRGFIWLDVETNRLVRIAARQLKLPRGCRAYEYRVDLSSQRLFDKELSLPMNTELKVELKDKGYQVDQHYGQFESN